MQPALPWGLEAIKNWAWRSWWAVAALACKVTLGCALQGLGSIDCAAGGAIQMPNAALTVKQGGRQSGAQCTMDCLMLLPLG